MDTKEAVATVTVGDGVMVGWVTAVVLVENEQWSWTHASKPVNFYLHVPMVNWPRPNDLVS